MKNKNVRGIIALALVTALSFGVIAGSRALSHNIGANTETVENESTEKVLEELDTADAENIEKAIKTENGYMVTVKTKGYGGDILMNVSFDADAKTVTKVEVLEQSETDGVGSKITEAEFLDQFNGVEAPVYLPGMETKAESGAETTEETVPAEEVVLNDGTYTVKTPEADANGYIGEMTMTVADGKITDVVWENVDAEGNKKSVQSENGEYVMTEDGLTWKEQAENLAAALVESQSIEGLGMNEEGKTDTVSGVSINIMGFAALAEECLAQAAGEEAEAPAEKTVPADGTLVDAVSGATISSTAAVKGINAAYNFLQTIK